MSGNPIIAAYDFPANERVPQKVVAELNFFVTKLTKILDKKAGDNEMKQQSYNKQVSQYILLRAKRTSDIREKRILGYIYKRFVAVRNMTK